MLTALGILSGIAMQILSVSDITVVSMILGIIYPVIILWVPFCMRGIGAGDIKLFSVIGCLNGGSAVIYSIFFSVLLAAVFLIAGLLRRRRLPAVVKNCFHVISTVVLGKRISSFKGNNSYSGIIHFSAAILGGYILYLGVGVCATLI